MSCLVVANPRVNAIESDAYSTSSLVTDGNFDCLLDLPPITKGCARLYLCRHGQTENNRLHLMQGARVDPPINGRGHEQAQRLGLAVSKLILSSNNRHDIPHLVVHSALRRARETAEVLTSTASSHSTESFNDSKLKVFGELPYLQEIDFGSFEGKDVNSCKREMVQTFANWSIGNMDARAGGEGESGREVLARAVQALEVLAKVASTSSTSSSTLSSSSSSILAVSHSTYLRVLLSLANDSPLAASAFWKIDNCSVSIVDVNIEGKRRLSSGVFGGTAIDRLRGNDELHLDMPEAHLIRRNEARHLEGLDA